MWGVSETFEFIKIFILGLGSFSKVSTPAKEILPDSRFFKSSSSLIIPPLDKFNSPTPSFILAISFESIIYLSDAGICTEIKSESSRTSSNDDEVILNEIFWPSKNSISSDTSSINLSWKLTSIPIPIAIFATSWPILPKPIIPIFLPANSLPPANDFLSSLNFESPSRGIDLFDSWRNLTHPNRWEKTSSATDLDEAAGVLMTLIFFDLAYSTSMLSIPTPPLPIILRLGQLSIISFLTCVALLTNKVEIEFSFI